MDFRNGVTDHSSIPMDFRNGVTDHSSIPTIRRGQYIKDHSLINMDFRNGGFDHSSSHISLRIGVTLHNYINRPGTVKFSSIRPFLECEW
jgi:hypothetical protein